MVFYYTGMLRGHRSIRSAVKSSLWKSHWRRLINTADMLLLSAMLATSPRYVIIMDLDSEAAEQVHTKVRVRYLY